MTEVRDLYTAKRPSDILVRRPHEERAPGEEASFRFNHDAGGTGTHGGVHHEDSSFHCTSNNTIAPTQNLTMGQYGHNTAATGPGTELKEAERAKRAKYRKMVEQSLPNSNRRTRFGILGF